MKVLSIEQMTRLEKLGVDTSKASLHYVYLPTARSIFNETDELESEPTLFAFKPKLLDGYPTFALQDVIELLPAEIETIESNYYLTITKYFYNSYVVCYFIENQDDSYSFVYFECETILDAAYQMLLWVIENGYLRTKVDDVQL